MKRVVALTASIVLGLNVSSPSSASDPLAGPQGVAPGVYNSSQPVRFEGDIVDARGTPVILAREIARYERHGSSANTVSAGRAQYADYPGTNANAHTLPELATWKSAPNAN